MNAITALTCARVRASGLPASQGYWLLGLAFAAASVGCKPEAFTGATWQCPSIRIGITAYTAEGDTTRHLLSVGDTGVAFVGASCTFSGHGCLVAQCTEGLDFEFASSDGSVVTPAFETFHGIAQVTFLAKAPGSVLLTARTGDSVASVRVVVVPAPLPIDSIRVRWAPWPTDSILAVVTDPEGDLDSLDLPFIAPPSVWANAHAESRIVAFRGGDTTAYLPMTVSSSDSTVVRVRGYCRFLFLGACSTPGWIVVIGLSPGTETITVTARSRQFSFVVRVR